MSRKPWTKWKQNFAELTTLEHLRSTPPPENNQRLLTHLRMTQLQKQHFDSVSVEGQARLNSCGGEGASAFLVACPGPQTTMNNEDPRATILRRLGAEDSQLTTEEETCLCGKPASKYHLETCKYRSAIATHDTMVRTVNDVAREAGCTVSLKEPRGIFEDGQGGPDGLVVQSLLGTVGHFGQGRARDERYVYDATIIHPLQPALLKAGQGRPLTAAKHAEQEKRKKYQERATAVHLGFKAFAFESFGAMGSELVDFLRQLSRSVLKDGHREQSLFGATASSNIFQYWQQVLSVKLQSQLSQSSARLTDRIRSRVHVVNTALANAAFVRGQHISI